MLTNEQFSAYAQRYIDTVYRVALNYLKSAADAEDITQNVFLKLFREDKPFASERYSYMEAETPLVLTEVDHILLSDGTVLSVPST